MVTFKCLIPSPSHFISLRLGPYAHRGIIANSISESVNAPLAQSVERLHGKEKVESSILSGSSNVLSTIFWRRSSVG